MKTTAVEFCVAQSFLELNHEQNPYLSLGSRKPRWAKPVIELGCVLVTLRLD